MEGRLASFYRLTKTLVSSGSAPRVLFKAVSISSAVPSKNRPQPTKRSANFFKIPRAARHTTDEESVSCEDSSLVAIFEEVAYAILGMAWSMKCLDVDVADFERLAVTWSLRDFIAVLAAYDGDLVCFELGARVSTCQ